LQGPIGPPGEKVNSDKTHQKTNGWGFFFSSNKFFIFLIVLSFRENKVLQGSRGGLGQKAYR